MTRLLVGDRLKLNRIVIECVLQKFLNERGSMNRKSILALALTVACISCERSDHPTAQNTDQVDHNVRNQTEARDRTSYDADNTRLNVRDRDKKSLTSGDQGENEADLTVTQNIRKALMRDSSLSTNAKNIKVITRNGVVTLRGPVNSSNELDTVLKIVNSAKGNARVDNLLEVVRNP